MHFIIINSCWLYLADIKNYFKKSCQSHKHSNLKKVSVLREFSCSLRDVRSFRVSSQ